MAFGRTLLSAEHGHRIDFRGPARWDVTGDQRYCHQHQGGGNDGCRIGRTQSEQESSQKSCARPSQGIDFTNCFCGEPSAGVQKIQIVALVGEVCRRRKVKCVLSFRARSIGPSFSGLIHCSLKPLGVPSVMPVTSSPVWLVTFHFWSIDSSPSGSKSR